MDSPGWKLANIFYTCVVTYQKNLSWIEEGAFTEKMGQTSKGTYIGQGQGLKPNRVVCSINRWGIECTFQRYQIHGHMLENVGDIARSPASGRLYSPKKLCTRIFRITWPIGLKFALKWSGIIPNLYEKFERNRWTSILSCVDLAWNDPKRKRKRKWKIRQNKTTILRISKQIAEILGSDKIRSC